MKPIEPFGFFRAEPFGWTNCAETDDGAAPLYDQAAIDGLVKQRDELLRALELIKANRKDAKKGRCDNVFHATAERIADAAITSAKGGA